MNNPEYQINQNEYLRSEAVRIITLLLRWMIRHIWVAVAFIVAGAGFLLFTAVADELVEGSLQPVDSVIGSLLQFFRTSEIDALALVLTNAFARPYAVLLTIPFLIYLVVKRRIMVAVAAGLIVLGTLIVVNLLKVFFERERPVGGLVDAVGYSFPSGHAALSMVVYGLMAYIACRDVISVWWARGLVIVAAVFLVIGTGLSRVYLQVHYMSDIVAGWAAGTAILFGSIVILEVLHRTRPQTSR